MLKRAFFAILIAATPIIYYADILHADSGAPFPSEQLPTPVEQKSSLAPVPGYRLVWDDEFLNNGSPDPTKWDVIEHMPAYNGEAQDYTANAGNVRIENQQLVLEARREESSGLHYTSGRVESKFHWLYGRLVVRAWLPLGMGTWPAIWTLPSAGKYGDLGWPDNGEVDMMEISGLYGGGSSVHDDTYNWGKRNMYTRGFDWNKNQYRVVMLDWTPTDIAVTIDGQQILDYPNTGKGWSSWPFDQDQKLIINFALGGGLGGAINDGSLP
jgi:beta-glucanase (GH16 family)